MMEFTPENVSDHLLCPICFHISKDKVFQCKGGHIVCDECYKKLNDCPQCRVALDGDSPIRNLLAEHLLDELKVDCPHKNLGCQRALGRKSFDEHVKTCVAQYEPENVCKLLGYTSCDYKIHSGNVKDAIEHFKCDHGVIIYGPKGLISKSLVTKILFSPTPKKEVIIINREAEGHAIFFLISTSGHNNLVWASYYLFYNKVEAEADTSKWDYITEMKLVMEEDPFGIFETKELFRADLMPKDILKIKQYPITNYNNLLLIPSHIRVGDINKLRLTFDIKKCYLVI